ncbi:MAG: enoyl-CoA hydratase/isomerase family protein [Syntrophales bacterium]
MEYTNILLEKKDKIAKITLNRPDKLNPLDWKTISEIGEAISDIEKDTSVKVVIITGSGKAFSAGGDLNFVQKVARNNPKTWDDFIRTWHRSFNAIEKLDKPVIAAVNGFALAGGLELVLACDLAVASEDARLGDQHINFGLIAGGGGTQRLVRLIGARRALEILLTGKWLTATEAQVLGIVNRVVPHDKLDEAVNELASTLREKSRGAMKLTKTLVNWGGQVDKYTGLELEIVAASKHILYDNDVTEGLKAFVEKRKVVFD